MRLRSRLTIGGLVLAAFAAVAAAQERPSRPGDGVTAPRVVKEVHPVYTDEAKRQRIQGMVTMDVVVLADGTVGDVTVTKSLDTEYGLDEQAVNAVKQWRFRPASRRGRAVTTVVTIELTFSLR